MSRASRCLRSNGCEKFIVEPPKIIVTIILPKCIATLLILLGVLAQMTGEAVSSAAASAATGGHHYQVTSQLFVYFLSFSNYISCIQATEESYGHVKTNCHSIIVIRKYIF